MSAHACLWQLKLATEAKEQLEAALATKDSQLKRLAKHTRQLEKQVL